jgi:osmoprotectant transport system ATP-binding protein
MLAKPANDFVAEFLGSDRAIKRLGVTPIPLELEPLPAQPDDLPVVDASATLRDALAVLMDAGRDRLAVRDADGSLRGTLTLASILRADPAPGPLPAPATSRADHDR